MNLLIALMAAVVSLSAHVFAQNFQHSCYSESSHCLILVTQDLPGVAWSQTDQKS